MLNKTKYLYLVYIRNLSSRLLNNWPYGTSSLLARREEGTRYIFAKGDINGRCQGVTCLSALRVYKPEASSISAVQNSYNTSSYSKFTRVLLKSYQYPNLQILFPPYIYPSCPSISEETILFKLFFTLKTPELRTALHLTLEPFLPFIKYQLYSLVPTRRTRQNL